MTPTLTPTLTPRYAASLNAVTYGEVAAQRADWTRKRLYYDQDVWRGRRRPHSSRFKVHYITYASSDHSHLHDLQRLARTHTHAHTHTHTHIYPRFSLILTASLDPGMPNNALGVPDWLAWILL
jgi:hypothetical protein